ncbi:MAG: hypothetical protein OXH79_00560 [Boseongicola sp.]|nr:hypothetical protein [Boseongicola sp.]
MDGRASKFSLLSVRAGVFWFSVYTLAIAAVTAWGCFHFRHDLQQEALSAVVRNIGVVSGGLLALGLAGWRSAVAAQQATIARTSHLDDRFQRAAEMLGNESAAVRIGGVQALAVLAAQHMDRYYVSVANLLEAFTLYPVARNEHGDRAVWHGDIQVAKDSIEFLRSLRSKGVKRIEMEHMQDLLPYEDGLYIKVKDTVQGSD